MGMRHRTAVGGVQHEMSLSTPGSLSFCAGPNKFNSYSLCQAKEERAHRLSFDLFVFRTMIKYQVKHLSGSLQISF